MLIINYYRGGTDRLSGFIFDTEKKIYKEFCLPADTWSEEYTKDNTYYSRPKKKFKAPGDISYYFQTKWEMESKMVEIRKLGFKKNDNMVLDFGVCTA